MVNSAKTDQIFKVLFLSLPRVVYDRNLHDRCTDFGETANFIIKQFSDNDNVKVDIFDASIPCSTLRTIYRYFANGYDLIVFYTDITDAPLAKKLCKVLQYISPSTHTFIYGDSTLTVPNYFYREPFEAMHICGDQEAAIFTFIQYLRTNDKSVLKGVALLSNGTVEKYDYDIRIPSSQWALPPIELLPIEEYKKFAKIYKNSEYACSVYVSKGCPNRCKYCLCGAREGYEERRRDIDSLLDFIERNKDDFDLFKMHSADFLYDKQWVENFCHEIIKRKLKFKWKTTVCFSSMDMDIMKLINEAGCFQVGFGVETFYKDRINGMKISKDEFISKMEKLTQLPMRYKGFVMLGTDNQTLDDINYTIDILKGWNIKVRPATYTPFYLLKDLSAEELDAVNLEAWNKKECFEFTNCDISEKDIYEIMVRCVL